MRPDQNAMKKPKVASGERPPADSFTVIGISFIRKIHGWQRGLKRYSASLVKRDVQIKITVKYHYLCVRIMKI